MGEINRRIFEGSVHVATRFWLIALASTVAAHASPQPVDPSDGSIRVYAVHVSGDLYGVYLGQGLVITAAHVVGSANPSVRIGGLDLPGKIIKRSPFEQLDLALLSVAEDKLPISLRLRRMPLCQQPPFAGEPVIVAIPEGTARSQVVSPLSLPHDVRQRFSTAIKDVATTGNSGSGVFDANRKCLLGIMSRKITVTPAGGGSPKDIAKYFVPAPVIRGFIPEEYRFQRTLARARAAGSASAGDWLLKPDETVVDVGGAAGARDLMIIVHTEGAGTARLNVEGGGLDRNNGNRSAGEALA